MDSGIQTHGYQTTAIHIQDSYFSSFFLFSLHTQKKGRKEECLARDLIRIECFQVRGLEGQLARVGIPRLVPPVREFKCLSGKGSIITHLHGEFQTLAIEPTL